MGLRVKAKNKWREGIIPYKYSEDAARVGLDFRPIIRQAMTRWERLIGGGLVQFIPWEPGDEYYVLITDGNTASMGDPIGRPPDKVSKLAVGTGGLMNVLPHELGHIMGLAHENERNTRFLIDPKLDPKQVAYDANVGPRLYITNTGLGPNRLATIQRKFREEYDTYGDYDLFSIMHYSAVAEWKFDCDNATLAEYCTTRGWPGLNRPTVEDVYNNTWMPSGRDIATLRDLYS
jgi:hypothetical protein